MLLIGYFEGLDAERAIAWRAADSLALREFLGLVLPEAPPDHSAISRTRRLIDLETHPGRPCARGVLEVVSDYRGDTFRARDASGTQIAGRSLGTATCERATRSTAFALAAANNRTTTATLPAEGARSDLLVQF